MTLLEKWVSLTEYQRNLWVDEYVFNCRPMSDAEMLAEARKVWETQPQCRCFLKGFDCVGGTPEQPIFMLRVPRYSHTADGDYLVLQKMRDVPEFCSALVTLHSHRRSALPYVPGDYSLAAFMAWGGI